jgi:hypothetical protein
MPIKLKDATKEKLYRAVRSTFISFASRYSDMVSSLCVHSAHKTSMKGQHASICLELEI